MPTTKIYENTTDQPVNVIGVGIIPAHDRISITTEFHMPVNLANYPGVIDVLAEEAKDIPAQAPVSAPAPESPASQADLQTERTEEGQ